MIQFIKIPQWLLKKTRSKILELIINFFPLIFTSIEIEGERVSSSQKKRTLRGGGRECSKTNKGEQEGMGLGQNSGILSERTF